MKGQINLEFLAAALLYLGALGTIVVLSSGTIPEFTEDMERASLNLEARQISTKILTTSGHHSFGSGGPNWHSNNTTVDNIEAFGLASDYLQVERDKISRMKTANPRKGFNYFNYTQFKNVTGVDNQYRFNFTWMPIVETPRSFTRGSAPFAAKDGKPNITEPSTGYYIASGNDIHYGSSTLNGRTYNFLVTSHDGVYNTTYVSNNWDFGGYPPLGIDDNINLYGEEYRIRSIQNRPDEPGSMLILGQHLKTFGASVDSDSTVTSMQRFALLEGEPLRVRVLAW